MADPALPIHPLAPEHLPRFITAPGQTDQMLVNVGIFLVVAILLLGVLYLYLHSLPDRMAHSSNSAQFQLIGVMTLLALFTHNNIFWVGALLLVFLDIPDFMTPLRSIAASLEKATGRQGLPETVTGEDAAKPAAETDHV
ncbi:MULTISPECIES: hypothetical protein [unclassified Meridianimarinicoccus]|uniref:hypothetical protein n=1 Tax=unclassified Meridianimarinicoccus TaxID=2923344 RepID=UPI001867BA5C|nr:hypothetical protein [Fluviibacterium sp. MJW13]